MIEALNRITALLRRHFYIVTGSPARIIGMVYWPIVQMILWGFISQYFAGRTGSMDFALGTLLGALLLWDTMFRAQLGVSLSYMEELWSRNLGHLFVSPIRHYEWWTSMILYSFLRVIIGLLPAALLAIPFYGFSIFELGIPVLLLWFNLMLMGWWIGFLVTGLLLRVGPGAEELAWAAMFLLAPFCAVYYPVSILPDWLQGFANILPASHVFEALRTLVGEGVVDWKHVTTAFVLNAGYMIIAGSILMYCFNDARRRGSLFQTGE